jgi:transcriptional regulator with XRE-family HTH domain
MNGFLNLVVMIQEDNEKTFGDYIKFMLFENQLTQVDLAVKINNSYQNISSLERNKFGPTLTYLFKLSDAFNISIVEFTQGFEDFEN